MKSFFIKQFRMYRPIFNHSIIGFDDNTILVFGGLNKENQTYMIIFLCTNILKDPIIEQNPYKIHLRTL